MQSKKLVIPAISLTLLLVASTIAPAEGQQPQIPTLQVCNRTVVRGKALIGVESRKDATHAGTFEVSIDMRCGLDLGHEYPVGSLEIANINMTDSSGTGPLKIAATTFEQTTTTGKASPTAFVNGRCKVERLENVRGCRYWLMIVDNRNDRNTEKGTADIVGFLVLDGTGKRIAYGTGPVVSGTMQVDPTPN